MGRFIAHLLGFNAFLNVGKPLLVLLNLIIQAAQILCRTAQYATLKAGEASLGHMCKELILQDRIGLAEHRLSVFADNLLPIFVQQRDRVLPFLRVGNLVDDLLDRTSQGFVLAAFRPQDFFSDGGDRHAVQVVVVDRLAQFFGHRLVDFIGVHNRRHDVLLAVNLTAEAIGFLVELLGVFVSTVLLKVPCVHINDQLVENGCTGFLSSCRDFAIINEPLEILVVGQTARVLEVNIAGNSLGIHIEICVAFVLALVVSLGFLCSLCGDFLHSDNAPVSFRHSHHLQSAEREGVRVTQLFQSA